MKVVSCSIVGLTYMDPLNLVPSTPQRGEDPCKPLYWYPRRIPDYCYAPKPDAAPPPAKPIPEPQPDPMPLPLPPIPLPPPLMPLPMPMPLPPPPMPLPMPMPMYLPMPAPLPFPLPMPGLPLPAYAAPAPMPLGSPAYPPNLLPGPAIPAIQRGLVPGVEGLVSPDGAINILPFSDAYSELLEKHKQKMIRRRLQKLLDEYEYHPKKKNHRNRGWIDY
ncbi:WAS/WASL-interacting protein family member 3-like isoform X2 [Cydia amplana]